ncbi:MAG: hypothetical protein AAF993_03320, partial [Pseudomonadota bacterium]
MTTLAWTRHKFEIGALAVLLMCVVVGCEAEKRNLAALAAEPVEPPPELLKVTPPPIVVTYER